MFRRKNGGRDFAGDFDFTGDVGDFDCTLEGDFDFTGDFFVDNFGDLFGDLFFLSSFGFMHLQPLDQ